jgi:membrane-associated phospholipid phosphatase
MPGLFYRLPQNVVTVFRGRNLAWHALAIVLTIIIVMSDTDWNYYLLTRGDDWTRFAFPAVIIGGVVPIQGILLLLLISLLFRQRRLVTTAWALGQAALLALLMSSTCKVFTGRRPPPHGGHFRQMAATATPLVDSSHGFQFGFFRGGAFWGWPSSHTTIAFAMAVCLITIYPRNKLILWGALIYAAYIGVGVSMTIHWLSEFVAGAIIGGVIGKTVGQSFYRQLNVAGI